MTTACTSASARTGPPAVLEVDNVVICAGQESVRDLEDGLRRKGIEPHLIGGAALAVELDAKRAIRQGTELAARPVTLSARACESADATRRQRHGILRTLAQGERPVRPA